MERDECTLSVQGWLCPMHVCNLFCLRQRFISALLGGLYMLIPTFLYLVGIMFSCPDGD